MTIIRTGRTVGAAAFVLWAFFALTGPVLAASSAAAPTDIVLRRWTDPSQPPTEVRRFPLATDGTKVASIAAHDLGADGVAEILIGSGVGSPPLVRVLRADGSAIGSFAPYDAGMTQGVTVAAGDLDGDGKAEIVTGTGPGAVAHVRVFDNDGKEHLIAGGFFPYGKDFRGGVNVAVADLDGDGKAEIVTTPGPTGGPDVKTWRGDGTPLREFFAFDATSFAGLSIAAGDLDGDGKAEIVAALASASPAYVRIFSGVNGERTGEFLAIGGGFMGGLDLAVADLDGDGKAEIIAAPAGGGGPHVHAFDARGALLGQFFAYDASYLGGTLVTAGAFGDGKPTFLTAPADHDMAGRPDLAKYIAVDVSEQRLRVYEYGRLVKTLLVATGLKTHPTPLGDFTVLDKPYKVNYRWSYGPGNPDNYDLGWVTWNLRFFPHTYIHYAPWRKIFGVRGSHGCVNLNKADAQWIYGWADQGTNVNIHQ